MARDRQQLALKILTMLNELEIIAFESDRDAAPAPCRQPKPPDRRVNNHRVSSL
jgi:hypothetical protein